MRESNPKPLRYESYALNIAVLPTVTVYFIHSLRHSLSPFCDKLLEFQKFFHRLCVLFLDCTILILNKRIENWLK